MQYEKTTIRALHEDAYDVSATEFGEVRAEAIEATGDSIVTYLTPKQARRLARALKRAANVAEGKPAKTPKQTESAAPEFATNGIGITFRRAADGTYNVTDCEREDCAYPERHFGQTLASLIADGGRVIS